MFGTFIFLLVALHRIHKLIKRIILEKSRKERHGEQQRLKKGKKGR